MKNCIDTICILLSISQKFWGTESNASTGKFSLSALILFGTFLIPGSGDAGHLPTLEMHNKKYDSACTHDNLVMLKKSLLETNAKAQEQAWKAINILLCAAPTIENRHYATNLLTNKILLTHSSVDDVQPGKIVKRRSLATEQIFAQGMAFAVVIASSRDELSLEYFRDSVCIVTKKLRYVEQRWRFTAIGEGCE